MKQLLAAVVIALPFVCNPVFAENSQQSKMATCNKDAGDKKGDERKAFMKECLSKKPEKPKASEAQQAQRDKMKTCNVEAKDKKGDDRKKFMSECLKKK